MWCHLLIDLKLISMLLTMNETEVMDWKSKLLKALGSKGQIIINVIPEVELIIGPQPPVPNLGPTENEARFQAVFQASIYMDIISLTLYFIRILFPRSNI
jgi:predicted ATPase